MTLPVEKIKATQALVRKIENAFLLLLLALMIVSGLAQLIMRNLFDYGLLWNDAFNKVLLLWTSLLGALAATRNNQHIQIAVLDKLLPIVWQKAYQKFLNLLAAVVCFFVGWHSVRFINDEYQFGGMAFAMVPMWLTESIIPIALILIALRYLLAAFIPMQKAK